MNRILAIALAASMPLSTVAPQVAHAQSVASWKVDKARSKIGFASSVSGAAFTGRFSRWAAAIRFDPANLSKSSVVATIDLASVTTGDSSRDGTLAESDWFNTARFPKATFRSTGFRKAGGNKFVAMGTLELRGVKKAISFPFTLDIKGNNATMAGRLDLDRTAFGVGRGEFGGTDMIPAKVRVDIRLQATR